MDTIYAIAEVSDALFSFVPIGALGGGHRRQRCRGNRSEFGDKGVFHGNLALIEGNLALIERVDRALSQPVDAKLAGQALRVR
jgi:hypothetical protein